MRSTLSRIILAASGVLLAFIGMSLLLAPMSFLEASRIHIEANPSLLSELSAPSGVLLLTGSIMLGGTFFPRWTSFGFSAGVVVYGTYGLSRLIGFVAHGLPSTSLVMAAILELGIALLLFLVRGRDTALT
ncbi:MAG: DUF4345 domain-containing protein [Pseudomonadota bacterium]